MAMAITTNPEAVLSAIAAEHHGVLTSGLALGEGVTVKALRHHEAMGRLLRVKRGIYRVRGHPVTWESRLQAALFDAGADAAVARRSAARLHGVWQHQRADAIEVVRPRGGDHRVTLGRLRETTLLPPAHVTHVAGFPTTTLARTCFDLAGDPHPDLRGKPWGDEAHERQISRVFNDALGRRGLTLVHEVAVLAAIGGRGRPGTALVRELLKRFGPRYRPTKSDGESLFVELLDVFNLPMPERQVRLGCTTFIGTVDFLYRPQRVVVEIDGSWHDGPLDQAYDEERDDRLTAEGFEVVRIRYADLILRPEREMARLNRVLHSRNLR
jgi:very-short-patch-repair endonuclease